MDRKTVGAAGPQQAGRADPAEASVHLFLTILGWIGLYYLGMMVTFVAMLFIYGEGHFLPFMFLAMIWPIGFPLAVIARFWTLGRQLLFARLPAGFADGGPVQPPADGSPWG